ncbi:acyl transferase [Phaeodactylibacter luteus]|uniref:Acyl transferase n=2 Tax=Phaeodactylibacter luteus TaxID=1564516 RepID=A0A5C6RW97_9BACT|nr:acyl transferase [Phaeodactylibacter luteus]
MQKIREVSPERFEALSLEVFRYQAANNPVYRRYLNLLGASPGHISKVREIPFLPISLFKKHLLQTGEWQPERVFSSSGTTGSTASRHALRDPEWYRQQARAAFAHFYGPVEAYCVLALLPSYLERQGSSLVFMAEDFIRQSHYPGSGFFLYNTKALLESIHQCRKNGIPVLLLGVSFALLDLAEQHPTDLSGCIIMETGGMKGRRRELTREELHAELKTAFGASHIHSEYGMTELLSQAYSQGQGAFRPAPAMQVLCREVTDPLSIRPPGKSGALNIIDLANLDTISFIATDDLGRVLPGGGFEVLGRLDDSDMRGCNLMVADL